ncbi:MAG: hypothetical protein GVY07_00085 [Bacteroidetes bacterium]|jgi:hypothetical protein|nr:hypothetical protein [Bacteroidota bacterium]
MKKLRIALFTVLIITLSVITAPNLVSAQAPPPPPGKPQQTPIDGGLGLLAAAGGAYAVKKLRDKKR